MTRYLKPTSGAIVKRAESIVESGDGVWFSVVGTLTTTPAAAGGLMLVDNNPIFGILLVPILMFISTLATYYKGTTSLAYRHKDQYDVAIQKLMPKIRGTEAEKYAQPILEQIYEHTMDGHGGSKYNGCKPCTERVAVMRELVPAKVEDQKALDAARQYLEDKKELESFTMSAYKELMEKDKPKELK